MRDKIIKNLQKAIEKTSILEQARKTGIPYTTLYRVSHGGGCNLRTWDRIEKSYKKAA